MNTSVNVGLRTYRVYCVCTGTYIGYVVPRPTALICAITIQTSGVLFHYIQFNVFSSTIGLIIIIIIGHNKVLHRPTLERFTLHRSPVIS